MHGSFNNENVRFPSVLQNYALILLLLKIESIRGNPFLLNCSVTEHTQNYVIRSFKTNYFPVLCFSPCAL